MLTNDKKAKLLIDRLRLKINVSDEEFDSIYPLNVRKLGSIQWTPVAVAKMASEYLSEEPGTRVLDIGSGTGKFCIIGASCTKGHFTGIEQRDNLVDISNNIKERFNIKNISYINANIMDIAFTGYDAIYFFNSFYENIDRHAVIDSSIERGFDFYRLYTRYVCGQLEKMPTGTKLATYWSSQEIVPASYKLQFSAFADALKFFIKV